MIINHRSAMPVAALLAACLGSLVLAGCGTGSDDGRPQVVAAFYPLAWAAQEVGGSDVSVTDLTTPGVEPHDLELKPAQAARISEAELVVYERDFQPSVDQVVRQNAADRAFDVSGTVDLRRTSQGADPHFWQDPARMSAYVAALAKRLAKVDPAHAGDFARRAERLGTALDGLDAAYRDGLAGCRIHTIVVSHDAFGYLDKYGVKVASIAGLAPDAEPSAKHIAELQALVRSDGITTIFSEVLAPQRLADTIARDTGVRSEVLDPIEGVSKDAPRGTDYLTLMRANLDALRKANVCS